MNRQTLISELRTYIPYNKQEERDRELILKALEEESTSTLALDPNFLIVDSAITKACNIS